MINGQWTMDRNYPTTDKLSLVCSVKIDGKMALISLYDDLPHFEYDTTIDNLKNSNKKLNILIKELEQLVKKLEKENSQLKTAHLIASKNIVSLYKTASREIKRKDVMINELRNSSNKINPLPASKMFPSNSLQLKKDQIKNLSNKKQDALQISCIKEISKTQNQNNAENIKNIIIEHNNDIPKTIYYKRMRQKLINQNENILSKSKTTKYKSNCTITSTTTPDKNVHLSNDKNIKESEDSILYRELTKMNSTLVICEPDIAISDSELNSSPVIQCENSVKGKENISSFSSKLKSKILKKKFVITPAFIKNMPNEASKCIEKLSKNKNLDLKLVNTINPQETNLIKTSAINNTESLFFKGNSSKIGSEIDSEQFLKTDVNIVHKHLVFTPDNNNQTPSINIEMKQVPHRKKTGVTGKNDIVKEISQATCSIPSVDNGINLPSNPLKCLSINNKKESSSSPMKKNNQLKCPLNNIVKSSPKNSTVEMNLAEKINAHCVNIVENQEPTTNTTVVIGNMIKTTMKRPFLNKINSLASSDKDLNMSTNHVKCLSMINEKESSSLPMEKNNQLECPLNDIVKSSKNSTVKMNLAEKINAHSNKIEVDQAPTTKNTVVIGNMIKKTVQKPLINKRNSLASLDKDLNLSTNHVKCLSMINEKESSSLPMEKNNQLECPLNDIVKSSKNSTVKMNLAEKINAHSNKIEVDQAPTTKNTVVIGNMIKKTVQKPLINKRNSLASLDKDLNLSTNHVKCLSMINEKKSSSLPMEKNNQLECPLNDIVKSSKNSAVEMHLAEKINSHSNNIEVDQAPTTKNTVVIGNMIKKTVKRPLQDKRSSLGPSDNNLNLSTVHVKCLSMNNEKESSSHAIEKNNQLKCPLNDNIKSSPKSSAVEMNLAEKINAHSNNIEVDQAQTTKNIVVIGNMIKKTVKRPLGDKRSSFGPSDNSLNLSTIHVKCLSMNNEKESSSHSMVKNNQLELPMNDIVKNSPKKSAVEMNLADKISVHSNNVEVDQAPTTKNTVVVGNITKKTIKRPLRDKRNPLGFSDNNSSTVSIKHSSMNSEQKFIQSKEINNQLELPVNDIVKSSPKNSVVKMNSVKDILTPLLLNEVGQSPFTKKKRKVVAPVDSEFNKDAKNVQCLSSNIRKKSCYPHPLIQNDSLLKNELFINNKCINGLKEFTNDDIKSFSKSTEFNNDKTNVGSPKSIDPDYDLVRLNIGYDENNQEMKKGRRVKLITIQDHYSEPLPSFNGAKKTEIDVSKTSVHIEKVVESSSRFYVPQVKRRNFTN